MGNVTLLPGEPRTRFWIAAAVLIVGIGVVSAAVRPGSAAGDLRTLKVMSRNIYLGGDITRPIRAALDRTGQQGVLALGHANHELRQVVDRTDFGTRSRLLAEEIAAAQPDLVGLQEVALWRHGPMQLDSVGPPDATEVDYDFLAILLADLANRGVHYQTVHIQQESDVEAPAFTGNPFSGTAGSAEDVRLTDRDVILVRSGAGIKIDGSGGGHYRPQFAVKLGDRTFPFLRGYSWADVDIGSTRMRFITTHLESQSSKLARAQAEELLNGPAADTGLSTIIVCDCNSNPSSPAENSAIPVGSGDAYRMITNDRGFSDLWLQQPDRGGGNTASLGELLNDKTADFERRIDLALARPAPDAQIVVSRVELTGDELSDRDAASKLWPSDHAGVVVELRIG